MRTGIFFTGLLAWNMALAQYSDRISRPQYFDIYKEIAIKEMKRSGVPASITLAQGALESGDGNSRLAKSANNHFGIKCHNDWNGKKIFEDDDQKNECFRKYPSVEDSYRDHSDYLRSKSRYSFLFDLEITDYKGWAKGLKKAGYATSPTYASALIKIIEDYNLSVYDRMEAGSIKHREKKMHIPETDVSASRQILERNRVKYILARKGDTFESVTQELGKLDWELKDYNDIRVSVDSLVLGQVIYIQPKRNKAETGRNTHTVKEGETMYTISQLYALKLSRLYAMNNINPGAKLSPGTILQLRKPVKKQFQKPVIAESEDSEEIRIDVNLE